MAQVIIGYTLESDNKTLIEGNVIINNLSSFIIEEPLPS